MEIRSSPVEVGSDYPIYKALYIPAACLVQDFWTINSISQYLKS